MGRKKKLNGSNGVNHEALEAVSELGMPAAEEIAPAPSAPQPKRSRYLKCILTQFEKYKLGKKSAKALGEAEELELELDQLKDTAKNRQKAIDVLIEAAKTASRHMRDGFEFREVECIEEEGTDPAKPDSDLVGVITIRVDTGEPIDWRPFTASERQGSLFDAAVTA